MTAIFAWICAGVAALATLGAAYFFDKSAEEGIAAANEKAAQADHLAGQAHERAALLEKQAAQLREDNLTLEQTVASRRWYGPLAGAYRGGATGTELSKLLDLNSELSKFPKMPVVIVSIPLFEAEKLAVQISSGLSVAGWSPKITKPEDVGIPSMSVPDGVQIWTGKAHDGSWKAAEALARSFAYEGLKTDQPQANIHRDDPTSLLLPDGDVRKSLPQGTVVILVGEKPGFAELMMKLSDAYRAAHPNEN